MMGPVSWWRALWGSWCPGCAWCAWCPLGSLGFHEGGDVGEVVVCRFAGLPRMPSRGARLWKGAYLCECGESGQGVPGAPR